MTLVLPITGTVVSFQKVKIVWLVTEGWFSFLLYGAGKERFSYFSIFSLVW